MGWVPGTRAARRGGLGHDALAGLVPEHGVARVGDLGRGVLGVGVVDVEPGPVGEDDVGEAQVLVGELGGVCALPREVESAGVAQWILLFEVPSGSPCPCAMPRGTR